jgi:hypothetical protein
LQNIELHLFSQDLIIESCSFYSADQGDLAQNRISLAFNTNANDIKVRNNRSSRFGSFAVVSGSGSMFHGNHFFGGDSGTPGVRRAGIVLTRPNCKSFITGNYIDNSFIELSNEHDETPNYSDEYSFGGLTITGNTFTAQNVVSWFSWLVVAPKGTGHFIAGLNVIGNVFYARSGDVARVETVDTSHADLNYGLFRNVTFSQNSFNGVDLSSQSPLLIEHSQNSASDTWAVNTAGKLPFGGKARNVVAVVPEGAVTNSGGTAQWAQPYAQVEQGAGGQFANLRWPSAVKGKVQVTLRVDNPA